MTKHTDKGIEESVGRIVYACYNLTEKKEVTDIMRAKNFDQTFVFGAILVQTF